MAKKSITMQIPLISFIFPLVFLLSSLFLFPSSAGIEMPTNRDFRATGLNPPEDYSTPWVDSVFHSLNLEQRIAQLIMVEVQTDLDQAYYRRISSLIKRYNIGGMIFFRGSPQRQLLLTNRLQSEVQTPMFVAMDAEWGLAMRLDSTISFPRQMTLGAISNERLLYEYGMEVGRQVKRMGIHINFAPVVDVNSNPENPVINSRSFGECRYNVTRKSLAYMLGMQDAGIIACAKHFPGHGDTDQDSHYTLPVIQQPLQVLDSIHLFPFRHHIQQGIMAIMIAHLNIPVLDDRKKIPSSLSEKIVDQLLVQEMGFKGLVITDGLNMRGVSGYLPAGELELQALIAGNDILLQPENVHTTIKVILEAIENGRIDAELINQKCRKVLYFKEQAGLNKYKPSPTQNLHAELNTPRAENLNKRLAEASITVVKNETDLLPLQRLDTLRIASLAIGAATENPFQNMLRNYYPLSLYSIPKNHNAQKAAQTLKQLSRYNLVIVSVHNNSMFPSRNYGISAQTASLVNALAKSNNIILNVFANPYSLKHFGREVQQMKGILVSYQDGLHFEEASAQVIFGGITARGKLPVSVSPWFPVYTHHTAASRTRLRFHSPEDHGIHLEMLSRIDTIALNGIRMGAFPGCQIAVIKDGSLVYHKAFGHHTYEKERPVRTSDLYDLASVTKIAGTTAAIMRLVDEGKIKLNDPISDYLPWMKETNKVRINLREIMAHQAMLRSWIPFHLATLEGGNLRPDLYRSSASPDFPTPVAEGVFLQRDYRDSIMQQIAVSELLNRKRYVYSDLGFFLLAELVKEVTGMSLDTYLQQHFFSPMALNTMTFNPLNRFPKDRIIPTEKDTLWRGQLIHGYVHDPGAAMLGGVTGNAGLFSNALDLAVMMQMFLQEGQYGGLAFIRAETLREFTRTQFAGNQNRRALGFDKPTLSASESSPAAKSASIHSYGHTGFTGTYAWVDPRENLVVVFLSNRVYPDAANRKISQFNIRTNIHQAAYNAIYYARLSKTPLLP